MASSESTAFIVKITPRAKRMLKGIARKHGRAQYNQLDSAILDLSENPEGKTTGLRGSLASFRSLHSGRFRIVVKIVDTSITVHVVGAGWHEFESRDDIYAVMTRLVESGAVDPEEFD